MASPGEWLKESSVTGFRFGVFRVDVRTGELFRGDARVRVQEQPFRVLLMLLSRPGELLTRDELRENLWPAGTFVEFDHSLNTAIKKLRQCLGDDADNPLFIETIPRRGYRFIAPVFSDSDTQATSSASTSAPAEEIVAPEPSPKEQARRRAFDPRVLAIVAVVLVAATIAYFISQPRAVGVGPLRIVPLTADAGFEDFPSISPDGSKVVYMWAKEGSAPHLYVRVIATEQTVQLTKGDDSETSPVWSPDGASIAFMRCPVTSSAPVRCGLFLVSAIGGTERLLATISSGPYGDGPSGPFLTWAPDGKTIVYTTYGPNDAFSLFALDMNTLQAKQLTSPRSPLVGDSAPAFSPDGKQLAFIRNAKEVADVWTMSANGGNEKKVSSKSAVFIPGVAWSRDGKSLFVSGPGLTRLDLASGNSTELVGGLASSPSVRGDKLAFALVDTSANLWSVALDDKLSPAGTPQMFIQTTRLQEGPSFSPDGKRLVFQSTRTGNYEIWRADADGTNLLRLTNFNGPLTGTASYSPDGSTIVFDSRIHGHAQLFRVSSEGGPVTQITDTPSDNVMPSFSVDGKSLYFSSDRNGRWNVWKIPIAGGSAQQITQGGGFNGHESQDGTYFYYSKGQFEAGIWRVPSNGGEEAEVLSSLSPGLYGYWCLYHDQILYAHTNTDLLKPSFSLRVHDLQTGADRELLRASQAPSFGAPGLAISPDGKRLLYVLRENGGADLHLAEGVQ